MKKLVILLLAIFWGAVASAQAWNSGNTQTASVSGAATVSATYASSFSAATLVAFLTVPADGSSPTALSGCGGTWQLAASTGPGNGIAVYYAMNVSSASCAVTATFAANENLNLVITQGTGFSSSYALELWTASPIVNCCSSAEVVTQMAGDSILSVTNFGSGSSGCTGYNAPTGFTTLGYLTSSSTSGLATGVSYRNVGIASLTLSPTFTCGFGVDSSTINLVFRPSLPNPGRLQFAPFTTATSEAYPLANRSGSTLLALCAAHGTFVYPTDTVGNTWKPLGVTLESDSGNFYSLSAVINAPSAASNTVSCGASSTAMAIWEYTGVSTVNPIGATTAFFSSTDVSTFYSGQIGVNSTSVIFSVGAIMGNSATLAGSAGFAPVVNGYNGDSIQQWDEIVSNGLYSNTVTASTGNYYPNVFMLALESTAITVPQLTQHMRGSGGAGADGPNSAVLPAPVQAGQLVVVAVANQSGYSPGTQTDSQGNTYTLIEGGGSDQFGLYATVAGSTGTLTVSNSDSNCIGADVFSFPSAPSLDQHTSQTNAGAASLSSGTITISTPNELIVSAGFVISSSYRLFFDSQDTGWNGVIFACGGHDAAAWMGWQTQAGVGSYSDTWTFADSMPIAAAIASFSYQQSGFVTLNGTLAATGKAGLQ
jgi:hypothetical protein